MNIEKIADVMNLAKNIRKNGGVYNPLFVSSPGIGKTEATQQWATKTGMQSLVLSLSSFDPPDFKGFPSIQMKDGRPRLSFALPEMWPDAGEGVIILEELNRAPTSVMQCILSLTDARRGFDGYTLPPGWIVVGCINPEDTDCDVNTMDPALKDRFELYQVTYDKHSFLNYIKKSSWHKDVINFVEAGLWNYKRPEEMGKKPGDKYNSPRTFSKLNNVLLAGGFDRNDELIHTETILGRNVAKDFHHFRYNESPVSVNDLRTDLKGSLKRLEKFSDPNNYKNGMISITVRDIVEDGTLEEEPLVKVLTTVPVEQSTVLIKELEFKKDTQAGTYLSYLLKTYPELKKHLKDVVKYNR